VRAARSAREENQGPGSMMPSDVDRDATNTYGLGDWSPDALDRLRRFVAILDEWHAAHERCRATRTSRDRGAEHSFESPLAARRANHDAARKRPHNSVPEQEKGRS
jgi:hypothetical protein